MQNTTYALSGDDLAEVAVEANGWLVAGRIAALIVLNIISVVALIVLCAMRGSLKERGVSILPQAAATEAGLTKEEVLLERVEMTWQPVPEDVTFIEKPDLEVGDLVVIRRSKGPNNYAVVNKVGYGGVQVQFKSVGKQSWDFRYKPAQDYLVGVVKSWDTEDAKGSSSFAEAIEMLQTVQGRARWSADQIQAFTIASNDNILHCEVQRCIPLLQDQFQAQQMSHVDGVIRNLKGRSTIAKPVGATPLTADTQLHPGQLVLVEPLSDKQNLQFGYVYELPKTDDPQLGLNLPLVKYYAYSEEADYYNRNNEKCSYSLMLEGRVSLDRMYTPRRSDLEALASVERSRYDQKLTVLVDRLHSEGHI